MPASAPECDGLLAGAAAHLLENTSRRPVFGYVVFCNVDPADYDNDLATTIHEILHALVRPWTHPMCLDVLILLHSLLRMSHACSNAQLCKLLRMFCWCWCRSRSVGFACSLDDDPALRTSHVTQAAAAQLVVDLRSGLTGAAWLQVLDPPLFDGFMGYSGKKDIVRKLEDGRTVIKTPQVTHMARTHLGCDAMEGAELEDDGVQGSAGSHWEQRVFEV